MGLEYKTAALTRICNFFGGKFNMDPWPRADTVGISGFNAARAASQRQPTLPRADSVVYAGTVNLA